MKEWPLEVHGSAQVTVAAEELHTFCVNLRKSAADPAGLSDEAQSLLMSLPEGERKDPEAIESLRKENKKAMAASPSVTLILAAIAPRSLKLELVRWFRLNVNEKLLVDFLVNPAIGGGVVVQTTNHIYDFSFRRALLDQTSRFSEILKGV